ncbi:MAG: hypothetical protein ACTHKJ_00060, partial [Candidatus Nitrosocosmicus sp.]
MTDAKYFRAQEITLLLEDAKKEIDRINQHANEKKKDIVIKLAKDLEAKIQIDKICMVIVRQLKDKVSDTLIRDCLPQKYKQGRYAENAKKQKKKESKLVPVVVQNQ